VALFRAVNIKATRTSFLPWAFPTQTAEKTLTVTVTKNPDDDGAFHITTVDVSTPENTDKMITLATNKGGASFTIVGPSHCPWWL
jgi:hypothetical protein